MNTSRMVSPWLTAGLTFLFSGLMIMSSRTAAINIIDAIFFIPALFFILRNARTCPKAWSKEHRVLALFLMYAVISTFFSDSPNISRFLRAAVEIGILFALFRVLALRHEALFWRSLYWGCALTAVVCMAVMIVYYGFVGHPLSVALYALPASGPLNMDLNQLYASMLVVSLPFLMNEARKNLPASAMLRWTCHAATATFLIYLIANQRRSALVALAAGCMILLVSRFSRRTVVTFLGVAALVLAAMLVKPDLITSRGLSYRLEIWTEALDLIRHRPIFGYGLSSEPHMLTVVNEAGDERLFSHPHNYFLSLLYHLGIVGLVLWALAWIGPWLRLFFVAPAEGKRPFLLASLCAGLTTVLFDGTIYPLSPFQYNWGSVWIPMAILLATATATGKPYSATSPAIGRASA